MRIDNYKDMIEVMQLVTISALNSLEHQCSITELINPHFFLNKLNQTMATGHAKHTPIRAYLNNKIHFVYIHKYLNTGHVPPHTHTLTHIQRPDRFIRLCYRLNID